MAFEKRMLLALDPGKDKTGLVIVDDQANPIYRNIIKTSKLDSYLGEILSKYDIEKVIMGNGTTADRLEKIISKVGRLPAPVRVEETDSTRQARERYWQENPPHGFKAILRLFIDWPPPQPVDDYAALILAERFLSNNNLND